MTTVTENIELKAQIGQVLMSRLVEDGSAEKMPEYIVTIIGMIVEMMRVVGYSGEDTADFVVNIVNSALTHYYPEEEDDDGA